MAISQPATPRQLAPQPIKVLVVDDTVTIRRLVTTVLEKDPAIAVIGTASNGRIALRRIAELKPDVVTLDIEMPEMDGLETLREIRRRWPELVVIMLSTLTSRGASATLSALSEGANDYVAKPSLMGSVDEALSTLASALLPSVKHFGANGGRAPTRRHPSIEAGAFDARCNAGAPERVHEIRSVPRSAHDPAAAVVIAVSTGGPNALAELVPRLPASLTVPVIVVQHMPAEFTKMLAERLDKLAAVPVVEAAHGDEPRVGTVYIAPGGRHLVPTRSRVGVRLLLTDGEPENFCRPAADVTFRAAADIWGPALLATVLTGMGRDGLDGCRAISAAGGQVLAQDEASSVVWGMPGFVARAGLASDVVPLADMADAIVTRCRPPHLTRYLAAERTRL